jgi:hypothetical protein
VFCGFVRVCCVCGVSLVLVFCGFVRVCCVCGVSLVCVLCSSKSVCVCVSVCVNEGAHVSFCSTHQFELGQTI